uniref:Retrovirus-related Pol polyprotein from transposon TNT 1-94 n=1 Tax=Tanacetum cinerariifolium TaxID=118510 RepID=A0A699I3L6_TANCI|nr:retrovirus-related Pol polyprotein from transposon TNT 1-94 [Tanacetum cinerariifolium]
MRPFGCHVTILNTLDHLGKFDGKSDDGFFVGYLLNSKAFRVYNLRTRKVEENLHVRFFEDKPSIAGNGPKWLFDIDVLTKSMNYMPVVADGLLFDSCSKNASNDEPQPSSDAGHKDDEGEKKDKRDIMIMNKARLVAYGYTQEESIDYDEFFAPVARIKAITLFLAYASFVRFMVYQMDIKSAFLYGRIEEEVYMCQPLGFEDPDHPDKVYKVVKALYGLHQAPWTWPDIMFAVYACAMTKVKTVNEEEKIQALVDKKKVIITETSVRSDLHLEDAEDKHVTTTSTDPLLSGEDRLKLTELMELCTRLQSRVLALKT